MKLDVESRRELVRAVEGSLEYDDVPDDVLAIIDARLAKKGSGPDGDAMSLDEFERRIHARRRA